MVLGLQVVIGLIFGFLGASGNWIGAAAVLGAIAGLGLLLSGPRVMLVLLLVGSPTFFVFLNNYLHVLPVVTLERLLVALLAIMVFTQFAWGKLRAEPLIAPERWMLGFLAVALVSLSRAALERPLAVVVSQDAALYVQAYLMPFAAFMLARRVSWDEHQAETLGRLLLFAGVVLFASAVLQVFLGVMAFVPTYMTVIHSENRATGVFNNGTEFGMVMNACLLIALLFFARSRDGMVRLLLLVLVAATFAGILLSQTRATWVGVLASLAFLYFADRRLRPYLVACATLAIVAAIVALPFLMDTEVFQKRISDVGPILNRLAGWATAVNMVLHNPLLGVGFTRGAFGANAREYLIGFGPASAESATVLAVPHNEHLNVAVLTGLVGFVLYVGVYASVFAILRRVHKEHAPPDVRHCGAIYVAAMLTSYLVNGIFVDFGPNIYIGLLVFACAGLVSSREWRTRSEFVITPRSLPDRSVVPV